MEEDDMFDHLTSDFNILNSKYKKRIEGDFRVEGDYTVTEKTIITKNAIIVGNLIVNACLLTVGGLLVVAGKITCQHGGSVTARGIFTGCDESERIDIEHFGTILTEKEREKMAAEYYAVFFNNHSDDEYGFDRS